MSRWVVDGAPIRFDEQVGWNWDGWDGCLELSVPEGPIDLEGRAVAVARHVVALQQHLVGKSYKAKGFDGLAGEVERAVVAVDEPTLCEFVTSEGNPIVLECTTGTFSISCLPAVNNDNPSIPIPDPAPFKTGSWRVNSVAQDRASSEQPK